MRNKKGWIAAWAILVVFVLAIFIVVFFSGTAEAADISSEPILETYTGSVNGIERSQILTKSMFDTISLYFKIQESEPKSIFIDIVNSGFDRYGTVYVVDAFDSSISWWNYDLSPDLDSICFEPIPNPDPTDPITYVHNVESLVYEGSGSEAIVVGYKTFSGEIYPLLSFEEMKAIVAPDSSVSEPSYIPKGGTSVVETPLPSPTITPSTPTPSEKPSESPTLTPTSEPSPTEKPSESPTPTSTSKPMPSPSLVPPTQAPSVSTSAPLTNPPSVVVQPTATPKVSKKLDIKTSKKKGKTTYSLCEGDKKVIEYTLFNGNLTWKAGKKKGMASGVRYAGFIKKSRNLYYGDKKGRGYTISSKNGKRKLIIKKGAKKPIYSAKFIVKVKVASKPINISNK